MTAALRCLLVGADSDEITALGTVIARLLHPDCELLAIEADPSSVDPTLAWGTERPRVRTWAHDQPHASSPSGEEQPLPEDGDTWRAVMDAAHRHHVDLVAIVHRPQGWFSRLFSGSAVHDLIAHGDLPVVVVPPRSISAERHPVG